MAIKKCGCVSTDDRASDFQDKQYGHGNRVHNEMKRTETKQQYRCTVCGNVRD